MSRYYRSAEIPAGAYKDARGGKVPAVLTVAVANLLVTTERTDPALTEAVTRTVIRSRDSIGSDVHPAQRVDLRTAIYTDAAAPGRGRPTLLPVRQTLTHRWFRTSAASAGRDREKSGGVRHRPRTGARPQEGDRVVRTRVTTSAPGS